MSRIAALAALLALVVACLPAWAQPALQTRVSTKRPEVGESFTLQLTALTEDDELPARPALTTPPGFSLHGPSITSQQQVSIAGGRITHRRGITATWTLVATRAGRFAIGPPSVMVSGRRLSGDRVTVEVVPAGQGRSAPGGRGSFDPFDPFSLPGLPPMPKLPPLFGADDDDDEDDELARLPPFPEELRVERAADPYAFLRAVATPRRVVVGEQVTLRIYAYGKRGPFRETATSEPSRPDFLAHTIVENSFGERAHRVPIDGEVWIAQKVREIALFPIKAGTLEIGPMKMGFEGRGYPSAGGKGLPRESEPVRLVVTEPPVAGRPAGYRIGDVGRFSLSANVEPRELVAGEAVSVVATLEGTGNLPFKLKVPQQHGVEWLDPTVVDDVEIRGSAIGGTRKLSYVVRVTTPGRIDLGELTLPYWDPDRDAYRIAKATLGSLEVQENPQGAPAEPPKDTDRLAGIAAPRKTLGAPPVSDARWADSPWFWLLLVAGPLGLVLGGGAARLGRRVAERARRARESASTVAGRALSEAQRAEDLRQAASHVERAVIAAIEAATGLRARGVLRAELPAELEAAGIDEKTARELTDLLDACDQVRFTGGEPNGRDAELVSRAAAVTKKLGKQGNGRRSSRPAALQSDTALSSGE